MSNSVKFATLKSNLIVPSVLPVNLSNRRRVSITSYQNSKLITLLFTPAKIEALGD